MLVTIQKGNLDIMINYFKSKYWVILGRLAFDMPVETDTFNGDIYHLARNKGYEVAVEETKDEYRFRLISPVRVADD
jgi:hypothetical protein